MRRTFPEVIYAEGKSPEQVLKIAESIDQFSEIVLIFGLGAQLDLYINSNFGRKSVKHQGRRVTNKEDIQAKKLHHLLLP